MTRSSANSLLPISNYPQLPPSLYLIFFISWVGTCALVFLLAVLPFFLFLSLVAGSRIIYNNRLFPKLVSHRAPCRVLCSFISLPFFRRPQMLNNFPTQSYVYPSHQLHKYRTYPQVNNSNQLNLITVPILHSTIYKLTMVLKPPHHPQPSSTPPPPS